MHGISLVFCLSFLGWQDGLVKHRTQLEEVAQDIDANPNPILVVDTNGFSGERIRALAISGDGVWLAAAASKEVRVWHIPSGRHHAVMRGNRDPEGFPIGSIHDLMFSRDSAYLLVGVADNVAMGSTRVYKMSDLTRMHALLPGQTGCTKGVALTQDSWRMATWGCGGLAVWDRDLEKNTGKRVKEVFIYKSPGVVRLSDGLSVRPNVFSFFQQDKYLTYVDDKVAAVFTRDGEGVERQDWPLSFQKFFDHQPAPSWLNGSADGRTLHTARFVGKDFLTVIGGTDRRRINQIAYPVAVYSPEGSEPLSTYWGHKYHPSTVAICPNRELDLIATSDDLGQIHVWRYQTGKPVWAKPVVPITLPLWGVAWAGPGQLAFADRSYTAGEGRFDFNDFGPLNRRFHLIGRRLAKGEAIQNLGRWVSIATTRSGVPANIRVVRGGQLTKTGEYYFDVKVEMEDEDGDLVEYDEKWIGESAEPMCYALVPKSKSTYALLVGTKEGTILEYAARGKAPPEIDKEFPEETFTARRLVVERKYVGHSALVSGLAISPDGELLASSSTDGTLRIFSLADVPMAGDVDFKREGNRVRELGMRSANAGLRIDDRILQFDGRPFYERLAGLASGKYRPGNDIDLVVKRGELQLTVNVTLVPAPNIIEPLVSTMLLERDEWIAWTPQGFYDSTPNAQRYLGWHLNQGRQQGAKFFSVEQFPDLYRPEVIGLALESRSVSKAISIIKSEAQKKNRVPPEFKDRRERETFDELQPPRIELVSPRGPTQTPQGEIQVEFDVLTTESHPESDVHLIVNGVLQAQRAMRGERKVETGGVLRTRYAQSAVLSPGENRIGVFARTHAGTNVPLEITVQSTKPVVATTYRPSLSVLCIGISKYKNKLLKLRFAHKDAQDFADLWPRQKGRMYQDVQCRVLTDEQASVAGIKEGLQWLSDSVKDRQRDVAIVFIAGHALYDSDGIWNLLTHDVEALDKLAATAIPAHEIEAWLQIKLGNQAVLFIDTCFAEGVNQASSSAIRVDRRNPWHDSQRFVLAGALRQQNAKEYARLKNGAFTYALVEAFKDAKADSDDNHKLSILEVFSAADKTLKTFSDEQQLGIRAPGGAVLDLFELDVE